VARPCASVNVRVGVVLWIVVVGDRVVVRERVVEDRSVGWCVVKDRLDEDRVVEDEFVVVEKSDGSTQLYWEPLLRRQLCRQRLVSTYIIECERQSFQMILTKSRCSRNICGTDTH
jgi:hypothetical protein